MNYAPTPAYSLHCLLLTCPELVEGLLTAYACLVSIPCYHTAVMFIVDWFNAIIYEPLYNGLIFVMDILPVSDAGIAVIVFTVIVKLILFPLSRKAVRTQMLMKELEPELKEIKERNTDDRQKQAEEMMAFYREKELNPFSSIFLILIQLPIIIALYHIFLNAGLPEINTDLLYSFVAAPDTITTDLFGLSFLTVSGKSWVLALGAAISGFFQIRYSMPPMKAKTSGQPNLKEDLARSMQVQMRYVFPVIIFFIAWQISGAIALYWLTSNLFTVGQEIVIRKQMGRPISKKNDGPSEGTAVEHKTE